jgi:20S proteasome subunit beta 6
LGSPGIEGYTLGGEAREHRFNPYRENGGSVAAIAGDDFVIIASDTRLDRGPIL